MFKTKIRIKRAYVNGVFSLDENDYKELINFSKPINSSRDYIEKEKDDYER